MQECDESDTNNTCARSPCVKLSVAPASVTKRGILSCPRPPESLLLLPYELVDGLFRIFSEGNGRGLSLSAEHVAETTCRRPQSDGPIRSRSIAALPRSSQEDLARKALGMVSVLPIDIDITRFSHMSGISAHLSPVVPSIPFSCSASVSRPAVSATHSQGPQALDVVRQIASDARHGPQQSDRSLRLRESLTVPVPRQPSSAHTGILVAKRQAQLKSTRVASVAVGSAGNSSCVRHNPEHRDAFSEATEDSGKQLKTTGSRRRITKRAAKSTEVSLLAQTSQIQLESSSHEHLDGWPSRHGESSKSASGSNDISEVPERCTDSLEHLSVLSDGCKDVTHATVDDALHPDGSSLPAGASDNSTCVGSSLVLDTSAVPLITTNATHISDRTTYALLVPLQVHLPHTDVPLHSILHRTLHPLWRACKNVSRQLQQSTKHLHQVQWLIALSLQVEYRNCRRIDVKLDP